MTLTFPASARDVEVSYRSGGGDVIATTLDLVSAEAVVAELPVREFRWYKGRRHYSGWYWPATGRRLVAYESRLEMARLMLADFDTVVTAIAAQPLRLAVPAPRGTRRHVPDILLTGADGSVTVVDVKGAGQAWRPRGSGGHGMDAPGRQAARTAR